VIVVLSGPGGVGKGSIVQRLVERDPRLTLSRSWTTRARRPGEPDDAYVWVDRPAFLARLAEGGFLEHDEFLGHLYGTPVPERRSGEDLLLEINVQGAEQVRARYPDALVVFVVAPSLAVQEARLRHRGDADDHVRRRLSIAAAEEAKGRELADHVVVNDELDRAVQEVAGILRDRRGDAAGPPPSPEAP
jgi:guanylate kinase